MKKPELLLPAGCFDAAIGAFEGGADAVYLGLHDFSARKSAKNFTKEELLKLLSYARPLNKKIYVTLNTLIKESELNEVLRIAAFLNEIEIDALILQDFGLSLLIRELFPDITLHASTQMAVHNVDGVGVLKENGFSRIVLSRELPFNKITEIKKAFPEMEIEVFVHGAMCYSFSGMCLASGIMVGRSGNRGECAQLCRNFYQLEDEKRYCFSCNDLAMNEKILLLEKEGIDSLKIEGRMKSPSYVFHTASLYRSILERKEYKLHEKNSAVSFSRKKSEAYFNSTSGKSMICQQYPGHRGIFTGICISVENGQFSIKTEEKISIRDGILFFKNNNESQHFNCSVKEIHTLSGKKVNFANPGEQVFLKTDKLPSIGDRIYLTSSTTAHIKSFNIDRISPWKKDIVLNVSISGTQLSVSCGNFIYKENIEIQPSQNSNGFINKFINIFYSSGDSVYRAAKIEFDDSCLNKFIQPAILKRTRNSIYESYSLFRTGEINLKIESLLQKKAAYKNVVNAIFTKRENFTKDSRIPFILENDDLNNLSEIDGYLVIPMMPVLKDSSKYFKKISEHISNNPDTSFLLGIANTGHISIAEKLVSAQNVKYFLDFHIYISNIHSYRFFKDILKDNLLFAYQWIENKSEEELIENIEIIKCSNSFNPPLFISLACFEKANSFIKCSDCDKSFTMKKLLNNRQKFFTVTEDCISFLYAENE